MKIAIIASGQPRFCAETDTFLQNLTGYTQADWFLHLWKENSMQHLCGHNIVAPNWISVNQEWALNKFKENLPSNHKIAALELADHDSVTGLDPHRQPVGAYKMFRGNYQADQLRRAYELKNDPYDLVIRIRPDLGLRDECNLIEIKQFLDQKPDSIIITKDRVYPPWGEYRINDWFAIAKPAAMATYCDALNHIPKYSDVEFMAETMIACHCIRNNLAIVEGNFHIDVRFLGNTVDNAYQSEFGRWA